ncbi:hypothetical protein G4V39_03505 [Thermosulfuriphilus ammonigenes]|uniref:DUF4398 domain-containing protein n=1 Tax=Thermosulfuriphilus ammonigenes TaxID=1936021 RepID=A0A6G7PUY3_9BACT|nr:hypothetical protein [Thermosulfuriphilus ammonigenes]QIJ71397.1 hypothetical protein G4V39_03505 [Thermosulfuriphilus ammonigenes]
MRSAGIVLSLILLLPLTTAFKVPEIPQVGPFKKKVPPSEALSAAQKSIVEAYVAGGARYSREAYEQAIYFFGRAKEFIARKDYSRARAYLNRAQKWARKARDEALNKRKELLASCLKEARQLRELLSRTDLPSRRHLELLLKITDLEAACQLEHFDEAQSLAETLADSLKQSS